MLVVTLHCWASEQETKVFHTIYTTHIFYLICLNMRIRVQRLMQCSMYTSWLNYRWAEEMLHTSSNLIARGKTPALLKKYLQVPSILHIINKQIFQWSLAAMKRNWFLFSRWGNWTLERNWVNFSRASLSTDTEQAPLSAGSQDLRPLSHSAWFFSLKSLTVVLPTLCWGVWSVSIPTVLRHLHGNWNGYINRLDMVLICA